MARYNYGLDLPSFLFTAQDAAAQYGTGAKVARLAPSTVVTFWSAVTAGTQYTDLLVGGAAATSVTSDANGLLGLFQGPDGITVMYADAGGGRRVIVAWDAPGPAGPTGPTGGVGLTGPGEPVIYWDSATSTYVTIAADGTKTTANRGAYGAALPVLWDSPTAPVFGTGEQQARDNVDRWRRTA